MRLGELLSGLESRASVLRVPAEGFFGLSFVAAAVAVTVSGAALFTSSVAGTRLMVAVGVGMDGEITVSGEVRGWLIYRSVPPAIVARTGTIASFSVNRKKLAMCFFD